MSTKRKCFKKWKCDNCEAREKCEVCKHNFSIIDFQHIDNYVEVPERSMFEKLQRGSKAHNFYIEPAKQKKI